jgi:archaellum biogenesis ATPase FlaH
MKQFIAPIIGILICMGVVGLVLYFNMPNYDPSKNYDIVIDEEVLGNKRVSLTNSSGDEVGMASVVKAVDDNTVLEFFEVSEGLVDGEAVVYLTNNPSNLDGGVSFPVSMKKEFVVDVTSQQLEEYQYVLIYDEKNEMIIASGPLE